MQRIRWLGMNFKPNYVFFLLLFEKKRLLSEFYAVVWHLIFTNSSDSAGDVSSRSKR